MPTTSANLHPMRPRGISLVLGAVLFASAVPATSAAPAADGGTYRVQMLYRTGKSLDPFPVMIEAADDSSDGMWYAIELYKPHGRWVERVERTGPGFGGYHEIASSPHPTAYGYSGAAYGAGLPRDVGRWPIKFPGGQNFTAEPTPTSRYYFVTAHADITVRVNAKGWRLKDVPSPGFRRVLAHQSDAVGARVGGHFEHFTSASAPGGRYGSAAFAYVACGTTGYGTARLTAPGATTTNHGYIPPHELECEPHRSLHFELAHTTQHVTWRLDGNVIGNGGYDARLVVFDFPKP